MSHRICFLCLNNLADLKSSLRISPFGRRYRAKREKPVTESRGISTAFQAEMVEIAYMPDTSCPVTLVSLGIAFQA